MSISSRSMLHATSYGFGVGGFIVQEDSARDMVQLGVWKTLVSSETTNL